MREYEKIRKSQQLNVRKRERHGETGKDSGEPNGLKGVSHPETSGTLPQHLGEKVALNLVPGRTEFRKQRRRGGRGKIERWGLGKIRENE